jgi:AcrR family transcriptional regulator
MLVRQNDRRVQRTRQLLRDALLALIIKQGYEQLTVQDILDQANLGRATFYAHYRDKQDLLFDMFAGLRQVFRLAHSGEQSVEAGIGALQHMSLGFFRHAAEQHQLYRAMVGKESGTLLHTYAYKLLSDELYIYLTKIVPYGARSSVPLEVAVTYLVSSLLALLIWWLNHDLPCSPEEIDVMFRQLALPGIASTFGIAPETI